MTTDTMVMIPEQLVVLESLIVFGPSSSKGFWRVNVNAGAYERNYTTPAEAVQAVAELLGVNIALGG